MEAKDYSKTHTFHVEIAIRCACGQREITNKRKNTLVANSIGIFPWILWHLWKARNALLFENISYSAQSILDKAKEDAAI
ncbi:hypothetical protein AALP_AA6G222000 [Arabis alpina]|uniref:Uncharacterized protein n=1 Tax=Arabis alpina TaxID=50452 RepID=A0A087GQX9_ARAAL|nr:hypothetical protein AALP_AA6G222000 [Arabis alpina]